MLDAQKIELPMGYDPKDAKKIQTKTRKRGEPVEVDLDIVTQQYLDLFRIADDIRRPRYQIWQTAWDLYNGRYDWSGKEDWQAKINIPKVRGVVDKATASFRRALIRMKRFYHIESETRLGIEKGFFTMSLIDYWLDQINFIEEFSTGLKAGLITSVVAFKSYWDWVTDTQPRYEDVMEKRPIMEMGIKIGEQNIPIQQLLDEPRTRGQLGFKSIDPFNLWIGPRNGYKIEKATVDFAYIEELAKKGVYDHDAVEMLRERTGAGVDAYLEAVRKGEHPDTFTSKYSRAVDLYHYWGDLFNEDGSVIARNVTYTMAGATANAGGVGSGAADIVLRPPITNPFFHGKDPYIVGTPYIVPFSTYNRGIVEDIIGIAKMITELSCLIIDGAQFDAMQAFEIDTDLLASPEQAKKGLYPGVSFLTKSIENPGNKNVIRTITTGKVPNLALNVLNYLDREQQISTNVTNAMKGTSVGAETLGEFQSLTSMASDSLDDAARTVEETVLDDMLDRIAGVIYQYHEDYTMPRLTENFPQTANLLADMEPMERYATMIGGFAFKARGVSVFLDKAQDLQKINSFIQLISNIPGVLTRINLDEMLENIIIGIGWNPSKVLLNPASPGVYPAVQGPEGSGQEASATAAAQGGPGNPSTLTPVQKLAAQQGAAMGGSRNNPVANAHMPLGTPAARSAG
jgi:hypothetical protein